MAYRSAKQEVSVGCGVSGNPGSGVMSGSDGQEGTPGSSGTCGISGSGRWAGSMSGDGCGVTGISGGGRGGVWLVGWIFMAVVVAAIRMRGGSEIYLGEVLSFFRSARLDKSSSGSGKTMVDDLSPAIVDSVCM